MRTRVHPLIVKESYCKCPQEIKNYLDSVVSTGEYQGKTYLDLIMFGSLVEDDGKVKSDVQSPVIDNPVLEKALKSHQIKYLHWVEHFWSPELTDGLIIRTSYFRQIIGEVFGWDNLLPDAVNFAEQKVADTFTSLIKGDEVLVKFRSAPERADEYWEIIKKQYRNGEHERALVNLGRVCHLLADVGTPAHVHGDAHIGYSIVGTIIKNAEVKYNTAIDDDDYEDYVAEVLDKSADLPASAGNEYEKRKALPKRWCPKEDSEMIFDSDWSLRQYFLRVGETARMYDSDNADGKGKGRPYRWQRYYIFNPLKYIMMERDMNNDLTDKACDWMASYLIPLSIRATAGVIAKFFYEIASEESH